MRTYFVLIGILMLFLVFGCKKSAELETDYIPVFSGNIKAEVGYKKVSFAASFINLAPSKVEDCGFEWCTKSSTKPYNNSIGLITEGNFALQIPARLDENTQYQVRAWIIAGSKKFYSQTIYFKGEVVQKPEIISINRTYALWGDTIRIKIRNLTPDINPSDIIVSIENAQVQPLAGDSTEVVFIMPYLDMEGSKNIGIRVDSHWSTNTKTIENALPKVTSISKKYVSFEDTVTLRGKFWPEYANRAFPVTDSWSQASYTVVSYTNDKIVFKIPDSEPCTQDFGINIRFIPPQGGIESHTSFTPFTFTRTGKWSVLNGNAPTNGLVGAVYNGEVYALDRSLGYYSNAPFYKYNPTTNQWTTLQNNPSPCFESQSLVECNGEIYAGFLRNSTQSTNLFKYNIQTNTWIPCAIYPPPAFAVWNLVAFSMKNKIYVFEEGANTKWIYEPINNVWVKGKSNVPAFTINTRMLIFNGEYYFYPAPGSTLYKYNIQDDTFTSVLIAGLSGVNDFFCVKDKIYFIKGCSVFELDMHNKTIINRPEFSYYLSHMGNFSFFFEDNSKAYFLDTYQNLISFTP